VPLALAAAAFLVGAVGTFKAKTQRAVVAAGLMMVLFFHAARLAMVAFDPYMSSRPLAEAFEKAPKGTLIVEHHYYWFSSVFFYTNSSALLLNGRFMNLEYGSYAPGAPDVFIDDSQFKDLWLKPERSYLVAKQSALPRLQGIVGSAQLNVVARSGGKVLLTNHPLPRSAVGAVVANLSQFAGCLRHFTCQRSSQPRIGPACDRVRFSMLDRSEGGRMFDSFRVPSLTVQPGTKVSQI